MDNVDLPLLLCEIAFRMNYARAYEIGRSQVTVLCRAHAGGGRTKKGSIGDSIWKKGDDDFPRYLNGIASVLIVACSTARFAQVHE